MTDSYFSERELGVLPQNREKIDQGFWNGLRTLIQGRINDGSLAERFPINCFDADVPIGCDDSAIKLAYQADFPSIGWPFYSEDLPNSLIVLDAAEFFYRYISKPIRKEYHSFGKNNHNHFLAFDQDAGRREYLEDVNRLFRRNSLAFELREDGRVIRLEPVVLRETLAKAVFQTEDEELNRLLEISREKFRNPDVTIRREAIEKLWDAWERLKTLEPGPDKKKQIEALLTRAIPDPEFRERINNEADKLTKIGNDFAIRHTETNKIIISDSKYLDYLFHRLFSLIQLLLRQTGRGG